MSQVWELGFALASLVAIALEYWVITFFVVKARVTIFNKKFEDKVSKDETLNLKSDEIPKQGYPDSGSGIFSRLLSYADWYTFNNYQRMHMNYFE